MILWSIELKSCFTIIICEQKNEPKRRYEWLEVKWSGGAEGVLTERRDASFTIYSWTIRIMYYLKVWKYIIAKCSLILRRGFLIRYAVLVSIIHMVSIVHMLILEDAKIQYFHCRKNNLGKKCIFLFETFIVEQSVLSLPVLL